MSLNSHGDVRPRTAVLHQWVGMGDLVWHAAYMPAIAASSRGGKISLIASPTTFARDLLGHEPWMGDIIDFDRHPRRTEGRQGRHRGVAGLFRMGRELREHHFDRIILLTNHTNRSLVANVAGIPHRLGYGTSWLQRQLLSSGPWIERYKGPAVTAYKDVTSFALAHGFAKAPVVPRLAVRPDALEKARARLSGLRQPVVALAIGSSEPYKQWGAANFSALATLLARAGRGVLLIGGPAEKDLAVEVRQGVAPELQAQVLSVTDGSVAETVALMSLVQASAGNDTGAMQIAAAVGTPTWVVLGPRPPLEHDPAMLHMIRAPRLEDIRPEDVAQPLLAPLPARSVEQPLMTPA